MLEQYFRFFFSSTVLFCVLLQTVGENIDFLQEQLRRDKSQDESTLFNCCSFPLVALLGLDKWRSAALFAVADAKPSALLEAAE